jgi:hypothetical protein
MRRVGSLPPPRTFWSNSGRFRGRALRSAGRRAIVESMDPSALDVVLGIVESFPCSVTALFGETGLIPLTLTGVDEEGLRATGPTAVMQEGMECQLRLRPVAADGHDVDMCVSQVFFESTSTNSAVLVPTLVVTRSAKRVAKRAVIEIHVNGRSLATGESFEARLADASVTGVGLYTAHRLSIGDQIALSIELPEARIDVDALVVGEHRGGFGRNRYGCEITRIDPRHHDLIARMADGELAA